MMMRGDMKKIEDSLNPVLAAYDQRITSLEARLTALESQKEPIPVEVTVKRGPGRPKGSKNVKKVA